MIYQKYGFLFFAFVIFTQTLIAQACCSGGVPVSSNLGLPSSSKGTVQWSLSYDHNSLRTLKTGSKTLESEERQRTTQSILLELGYSFTDRISVDAFLAYLQQERLITRSNDLTRTRGIGDAVFLFKYNLLSSDFSNFTVGLGSKVPFGSTQKLSNNSPISPALDLQSGSGAWDILTWINWNQSLYFRPSMSWNTTLIYSYRGRNKEYQCQNGQCQTYQFGQDFQLMSGLSDRLLVGSSIWDASALVRFRYVTKDLFNEAARPGTGGYFLFLTPSLSYWIRSDFSLNATIELPLYSNVQDTQLAPTYRFNIGVFHRFTNQ